MISHYHQNVLNTLSPVHITIRAFDLNISNLNIDKPKSKPKVPKSESYEKNLSNALTPMNVLRSKLHTLKMETWSSRIFQVCWAMSDILGSSGTQDPRKLGTGLWLGFKMIWPSTEYIIICKKHFFKFFQAIRFRIYFHLPMTWQLARQILPRCKWKFPVSFSLTQSYPRKMWDFTFINLAHKLDKTFPIPNPNKCEPALLRAKWHKLLSLLYVFRAAYNVL